MVEPDELNGGTSLEPASASEVRQVTVRQGVVDSTIISGDGNTVTIIHQYSRAEPGLEQPAQPLTGFPSSPYKGLEAFYEEDADRFFGRSAVVDTLWHRLWELQAPPLPGQPPRTRLLAIIGPSGSGKSSVARAGLIPELARRPIPGQANPRVALVVPQTEPIEALATVLARLATNDGAPAAKTREFTEEIRRVNQSGVPDGLRRIANVVPGADRHPLIVLVDQFEELFTSAAEADRSLFIETLLDAASAGSGRISIVLTLRSDFLSTTARYPALDAAIAACCELVPAMGEAELKDAILLPAAQAAKDAKMPNPVDQGTVELLVQETVGREGALPLLQFALNRIWEGLAKGTSAADTLRELGGVGGALASEADRVTDELARSGQQELVRRAFLAMVQLGEGVEDTRRRARLAEIVAAGEAEEDVAALLRRFARPGERLVTFASDHGETTLEVTHEQLIASWPTLQGWLRDWRDDERFRRRLAAAAKDWLDGRGSLWGPTELELLRRWRSKPGQAPTLEQHHFIEASETALRKQQRQSRLNTILTRIAAAVFSVLFLVTAVAAVGLVGASVEADKRTEAAYAAALEAVRQTTRAQTSIARLENEQGRAFEAASAALRGMVLPFTYTNDLNQTELFIELVHAYSADGLLVPPMRHADSIFGAAFDPKGERLVTASADKTARLWNSRTGEPIGKPLQHAGRVDRAVFDPTGDRLLTTSEDNAAHIWDAGTGEPIGGPLPHAVLKGAPVPAFDRMGERVVTYADNMARLWDARTGEPIGKPLQHAAAIRAAGFDPTGERVVTASDDKTARLWNSGTSESIGEPLQHADSVLNATFDPTGRRVLSVSADKTARIWNSSTGELIGKPLPLRVAVAGAATFDPSGERVLTASADNTARIWDARTGEPIGNPLPHAGMADVASFDPRGERVLTAPSINTLRIWDPRTGEPIGEPLAVSEFVWSAAFDPTGERIVTISSPQTVSVWDARTGAPIGKPLLNTGPHSVLAFDPKGERLLTASAYDTVRILDVRIGAPVAKTLEHASLVTAAAFDPSGERVVTASGNTAEIWNTRTGEPIGKLLQHADAVLAVAFDPRGELVVTASEDKTARIWDARTGKPIGAPLQHAGVVRTAAFDSTGQRVVTASEDKTARIWDARTGEPIGAPLQHAGAVLTAGFDATGERVVTASEDKTAGIWDARTGKLIGAPLQPGGAVLAAAFDPKGEVVLTTSENETTIRFTTGGVERTLPGHTVCIWDARTGKPTGAPLQDAGTFVASFDPSGERVVTGMNAFGVVIWDVRTGEPIGRPMGNWGLVLAAALDLKGERVVTASEDKRARVWDTRTGEPIGKPLRHGASVLAVAFDPAGEVVVTASADKTARIWRAPPTGQALVAKIRAMLGSHGPEPLNVPDNASRHESYASLMTMGMQALWARAQNWFPPN